MSTPPPHRRRVLATLLAAGALLGTAVSLTDDPTGRTTTLSATYEAARDRAVEQPLGAVRRR